MPELFDKIKEKEKELLDLYGQIFDGTAHPGAKRCREVAEEKLDESIAWAKKAIEGIS